MRKYIIQMAAAVAIAAALISTVSANLAPKTKAPDFTLPTLGGKSFKLSEYSTKQPKVIVLDIWATWCGPCRGEIPHLIALNDRIKKDGAMVVGVAIDGQKEAVTNFAKDNKINYTVALDSNGAKTVKAYAVSGIPATFIIDKKGVIRYSYSGFPSNAAEQKKEIAEMEAAVRTLLAEK